MSVKHYPDEILVSSLILDDKNPRFFHLKLVKDRNNLSQDEILSEIGKDSEIGFLIKSILENGVQEPIWVKPLGKSRYIVLEGNRRTYVLRHLCEKGSRPPDGIRYDKVRANIVDADASDVDLLVLKISLQTGKKSWRAFNEAAATYELRMTHDLGIDDIANVSMISKREVRLRIETFELFQDFIRTTETQEIKKFAYFSDMPSAVRKWTNESDCNKEAYYSLITPDPETGVQRLRSVATKGGVRDFARLLAEPRIVKAFINDDHMTMETALLLLGQLDIWKEFKWLGIAKKLIGDMTALDEDDVKKIGRKKQIVRLIKKLSLASQVLVERMSDSET